MKKFFILTKKELKELITPQLVIPLVIMVIIFAGIGNLLSSEAEKSKSGTLWVLDNARDEQSRELVEYLSDKGFDIESQDGSVYDVLGKAKHNAQPGFLIIEEDFAAKVNNAEKPGLIIYRLADSFSLSSLTKHSYLDRAIGEINVFVQNTWLEQTGAEINPSDFQAPLEKKEKTVVGDKEAEVPFMAIVGFIQQQTTIIPIILFMVIVVAAQMVATAVASEKESKTLETLLSLPIGRKSIVFAKLLAAGLVSFLFAGFYLFGFSRYINGITGSIPGSGEMASAMGPVLEVLGVKLQMFDYMLLGTSVFLGILAALAIALMLGLLADNVKSVQAVITPLMILILIPYLLTMFTDVSNASPALKYLVYAIPFSYPFMAMQKLMLGKYMFVLIGIIYQFIFFMIMVFATTYIFSTDKILTMRLGKKISSAKK